ncbi:DnaD domain protein [Sporosarcina sp. resist]|uniref:DnaD domain protein n=1 Tax=Sporosarcina sp. resist TaxID=2762563 RepID=UPI001C9AB38C|nr:DnaD domain protein [Sporosarcina sp. resist]
MNYIKLLNSFYDRLETNSLSTSAIALWHAIVHVNNKAGWPEEFTVAVSVLCIKTGLSERTVNNARNDLKINGLIDFRSRKGNKSAVYKVIDLSATITYKLSDKDSLSAIDADSPSDNASDKRSDNLSDNASALLKETKLNEIKQGDDNHLPMNPFMFFEQEGFGTLSSFIGQQLGDLIDDFGEVKVMKAMKETRMNGSNSLNYTKKILTNPKPKRDGGANNVGTNKQSDPRHDERQSAISAANERRKRIAGIQSNRDTDNAI